MDKEVLKCLLEDSVCEFEAGRYYAGLTRLKEVLAKVEQDKSPSFEVAQEVSSDSYFPDYTWPGSESPFLSEVSESEPIPVDEDSWSEESSWSELSD